MKEKSFLWNYLNHDKLGFALILLALALRNYKRKKLSSGVYTLRNFLIGNTTLSIAERRWGETSAMAVRISRRPPSSRDGRVVDKDRCVGFRRVELTTRVLSVGAGCFGGDGTPWRGKRTRMCARQREFRRLERDRSKEEWKDERKTARREKRERGRKKIKLFSHWMHLLRGWFKHQIIQRND